MRRTTGQVGWALVVALVALLALGPARGAVAQEDAAPAAPAVTLPPNPLEPAGRAVCNLAFSLTSAVGLTSFVVPGDAPLGPNDVIVALRPILETCVGVFPPAPARQCFTSDLYPSTGLPLTLPDPVGILTEQVEALARFVEPLGVALAGPLHDLFVSALLCQDLATAPPDGGPALPPAEAPVAPPSTPPAPVLPSPSVARDAGAPADPVVVVPLPKRPPASAPPTSLVSALPAPLRGPAVAAAVLFAVAGAAALRRLLSPKRAASQLGGTRGRR